MKREDLIIRFEEMANRAGVNFKDRKDKIEFFAHFSDGFMCHKSSVIIWWENNPDGGYNWWVDRIYDDHHNISGPGYPSCAIRPQKPINMDELVIVVESIANSL